MPKTRERRSFMQKTFIKYTLAIVTTAILLILFINFVFSIRSVEAQKLAAFRTKIEQVIHTLENNEEELALLNENLGEDYLTRARAAAYVLERQREMYLDVEELQYLADLLNVDEIHVIDENGIIVSASVAQYIGIDMAEHPQTREFLALLEGGEDAFLIQEPRPNAAEGVIRQYVGVARRDQKGIVQVGFKPTRKLEAESRNTYEYIFAKFPTDAGEELYVMDAATGKVLGHSEGMDQAFTAECYKLSRLLACEEGAFVQGQNGEMMYVLSRPYEEMLICAAFPRRMLFAKLVVNVLSIFLCLLCIEIAVILLLNYLVKRKVIDGIHQINDKLTAITNGNLDVQVDVGGNREFEELSSGINTMVKSIVSVSNRISAIIDMSGIPLAAFEYRRGENYVFVTSGVGKLLGISASQAKKLFVNADLFDEYIHKLTEKPAEGEKDIFPVDEGKYVRIHMSETDDMPGDDGEKGCLGVIIDASREILEKRKMLYENTHDALTGLCKYAYFRQLAAEIIKEAAPEKECAVVMMDLDRFKEINDTFGHNTGDHYLQTFARLMRSMPEEHFLTARRSGDEFCMMIYDCKNKEQVIYHLKEFFRALQDNPVTLPGTEPRVISASAGFQWTDSSDISVAELLSHADEALYEVKRENRGHFREWAADK